MCDVVDMVDIDMQFWEGFGGERGVEGRGMIGGRRRMAGWLVVLGWWVGWPRTQ